MSAMLGKRGWSLVLATAVAAGWVGCDGDIGGEGDGPFADVPPASEMGVGPSGLRRLTIFELDATLLDLVGDDTRPGLTLLPEDARTPFDNDLFEQIPSRVHTDGYETLAIDVSTRLLADPARRDAVVGCTPSGPSDDACMTSFVETFGQRAFRRPLTDEERTDFMDLATTWASSDMDFYSGVDAALRAMLQSAAFLYRVEIGTEIPDQPGLFILDDHEIATRMSYLIWGSAPDDALLADAAGGVLMDAEGRKAAAERMLQDPRALRQVDRFHAMWLAYEQMPLPGELASSMRAETSALIDRVVFQDKGSWLGLFTVDETFVDATLAAHYGLPAPSDPAGAWVNLGDTNRQGLLGQGSFLSAASNPGDTSPTKRGQLVRERLLCNPVPPPPPEVSSDNPPDTTSDCKWDAYAANRAAGPSCAGCHEQMDLVGFGLENFDMQGRFRAHDDGKPECTIEGKGEFVETGETFEGPAGLSNLLVDSGQLGACVVQHLMQYTIGRELVDDDQALVNLLAETFEASDHHFAELVIATVSADAFGFRLEMPVDAN